MIFFEGMKHVFAARPDKGSGSGDCTGKGKAAGCGGDCAGCPCSCLPGRDCSTLDKVHVGDVVSIVRVGEGEEDGKLVRLMELGLLPGMEVMVREKAPFGGPMLVYVMGTILAIRESEASRIIVEKKEMQAVS